MAADFYFGVDEVGRGCLAGPMVVCAFAAPNFRWDMDGLDDSKKLTKARRARVSEALCAMFPDRFQLEWVSAEDIDTHGLVPSHRKACNAAVDHLIEKLGWPEQVIMDGSDYVISGADHIVGADGKYPAVMAASVIAKVAKDTWMKEQAAVYPNYGFDRHSGYGTPEHMEALRRFGTCPLHRKSFQPVAVVNYMQRARTRNN